MTHTHTHTFFNSVDFHNSFWFSVILENQLDGIFYADTSSDESYQVFVVHLFTQKTRALCVVEEVKKGEAASLYGTLTNSNPVQSAAGGKKPAL